MERGERSVLGTGQTCREKWRGMECTGDWADMQKKNGERREECAGDWTDMQRNGEYWGLDRHAEEKNGERSGVYWGLDRHAEKTGEKGREREKLGVAETCRENGEKEREREKLGFGQTCRKKWREGERENLGVGPETCREKWREERERESGDEGKVGVEGGAEEDKDKGADIQRKTEKERATHPGPWPLELRVWAGRPPPLVCLCNTATGVVGTQVGLVTNNSPARVKSCSSKSMYVFVLQYF